LRSLRAISPWAEGKRGEEKTVPPESVRRNGDPQMREPRNAIMAKLSRPPKRGLEREGGE